MTARTRIAGAPAQSAIGTQTPHNNLLASRMAEALGVAGRTKRTAARLAIVAAIEEGGLQPGDLLPSELDLTRILGVSLGTVQAALRQLQDVGAIVRRRGDGSRVASIEPLSPSIWHFRFASAKTGQPLHIANEVANLVSVRADGPWVDFLGRHDFYHCIRRRLTYTNRTRSGAEMFIAPTTVGSFDNVDADELGMINIRPWLKERFGVETARAEHRAMIASLPAETLEAFDLWPSSAYFEVHARAFSNDNSPVYFQRIYVPADQCVLTF